MDGNCWCTPALCARSTLPQSQPTHSIRFTCTRFRQQLSYVSCTQYQSSSGCLIVAAVRVVSPAGSAATDWYCLRRRPKSTRRSSWLLVRAPSNARLLPVPPRSARARPCFVFCVKFFCEAVLISGLKTGACCPSCAGFGGNGGDGGDIYQGSLTVQHGRENEGRSCSSYVPISLHESYARCACAAVRSACKLLALLPNPN